jgi:hypothetical protein
MSYVQLRRTILPNNTGVGAPFSATVVYFDTLKRKPVALQFDSQVNDPAELTKGDEVFRYEYRPGQVRLVLYAGNGLVRTKNLNGATPGVGSALKLKLSAAATVTNPDLKDGCFDLTGQYGVAPYQLEVTGQGDAAGYHQTSTSQLEIYPVRHYNIGKGVYFLKVTDATGATAFQLMNVGVGKDGAPQGSILLDTVVRDRLVRRRWLFNELRTQEDSVYLNQGNGNYTPPYGTLVDAYLLPGSGGATWRQVYAGHQVYGQSNGGEVYFVDTSTASASNLALDNLILFNPDTTAEQNGGALLEMEGGVAPLRYALTGPGGAQANTTGQFEGLAGGAYEVAITDALGGRALASFVLEDRYRLWRYLDYYDLDSTPMRIEFWRRDYAGEPSTVLLSGEPVILKSDGLTSTLGGQGDVPSVVNTSLKINVLAEIDLFESVVIGDDRNCRVDFYCQQQLHFRGYLTPDIYTAPLLDGLQPVSLTATDGLADLKDADMLGHLGQRLGGHRPVLHTLLHCLSRTQISLPVQVFTNRRDSAMSDADAPELLTTTNRAGYYDEEKGTAADQRTVTDALAQVLGGTLVQRQGSWQVRSALEAALDAPGRAYQPAGTAAGELVAPAPTDTVLPPGTDRWHWVEGAQANHVRAGWKYLLGSTDVGWFKNAFWQGAVFSDAAAWLDDASKLRGTSGWRPPAGQPFPLVLQRVGEKGKDHSTLWPRSAAGSSRDGRYLESPVLPLAAGLEAVPAFITFTGKFIASEFYADAAGVTVGAPTAAKTATLPFEVVIDGHVASGVGLATFDLAKDNAAKDTTFELPLAALPAGAQSATLRLYSWLAPDAGQLDQATDLASAGGLVFVKDSLVKSDFGTGVYRLFAAKRDFVGPPLTNTDDWAELTATNASSGTLLLSSVGIQLRPQGATWDGEDNFRADGPGGNIRPTETLKSYHVDVPLTAGLYAGNLYAFGRGTGLTDGTMTTSWSRSLDKDASPLLEANVFDQLALRANPSRLVPGLIRHNKSRPPLLLDSVDLPFDLPGRRFLVAASAWYTMAAQTDVSLIEIGVGADAPAPEFPAGGRVVPQLYEYAPSQYAPYGRAIAGGGVRVVAGL